MPEPRAADARRRWAFLPLVSPTWIVLGGAFLLPLVIMLVISFAERDAYGGLKPVLDFGAYVASGDFLKNYIRSVEPVYLQIYWRSLWMAVLTTVFCLVISYPIAYYVAVLAPAKWKNTLLGLIVVPFWTSFLIRTYAWMLILRSEGLINTVLQGAGVTHQPLELLYNQFAVMIGLVYGELPFMILPLYASLEKLDLSLLEAATDLGANHVESFWRVTVPMTMPGIVAGIVLVFIPSIGQFVVSDLLGGAKSMLAGNLIQNQFGMARNKPFGSAVAFELTAVVLVLLLAYAIYSKRSGKEVLL
ncbi:MAG: ABC transporter permease [Thermoanaerobaculia bacterium]